MEYLSRVICCTYCDKKATRDIREKTEDRPVPACEWHFSEWLLARL